MNEEELQWEQADLEAKGRVKPGRRLVRYALHYKKTILGALAMLLVALGADLVSPFIAKEIIDEHIAGIERPWHLVQAEAAQGDGAAVFYDGDYWKRSDRFADGEERGETAHILQVGRSFAFLRGDVESGGSRRWTDDGRLLLERGGETTSYEAALLNNTQVFAFYRPETADILRLCVWIAVLTLAGAGFGWGQKYYLQATANRIIKRMRDDVFAHIQRLPIRKFDNIPAGGIVSRVTNDTEAVKDLYVQVLANFFSGILFILGILAGMAILDVRLGLLCALVLPLLAAWTMLYRKFAAGYNRVIRTALSGMNSMINESIQGMPIIQAFRREKRTEEEFETMNTRFFDYQNKMLRLNSLTSHNLVGAIRNVVFVAMLWYFGGVSVSGIEGFVTLGALFVFVEYINRMFQPVINIVNQLPNLERALVSAERVFVLLDETGEDVADETMPRCRGDVAFRDVWFSYKEGEPVLRGIDFDAKQGQTVALVGHTGSGKSSILNLLFRFYDVDSGTITIDGVDISSLPRQTLRRHMGIVLQDPFLFTGTIASNVSLDDPSITRERIRQALKDVGGDRMLAGLPNGIDEPVVEKGSTLSAGQRQLISFARALAFNPAILILDEATSNIDTETEAVIQSALDVVKRGRTTFVIAHRLSTIRSADLILVLDRGEIIERGTHDELLAARGKYFQMYQLQKGAGGAEEESRTAAAARA